MAASAAATENVRFAITLKQFSLRLFSAETLDFESDVGDDVVPISNLSLSHKAHAGVPLGRCPCFQPTPIGDDSEHQPSFDTQGPREMCDCCIAGNYSIQVFENRGGISESTVYAVDVFGKSNDLGGEVNAIKLLDTITEL